MAQPSTELNTFRMRMTSFLNQLNDLNDVLSVVEGVAATDPERLAFFQGWISQQQGYDITVADLTTAVTKLRALRTWIDTELPGLAKMRI